MKKWIVAFDVPDDKRRRRLAKVLEDFGDGVQYSVFELLLDAADFALVMTRINDTISAEEDSVRLYPSCEQCASKVIVLGVGVDKPWDEPDVYVV